MSTPGMSRESVAKGIELRLDTLLAGLKSAIPAGVTTLTIRGVAVPVADLVQGTENHVKPWKDMREARAAIRALMVTRPSDVTAARSYLTDLKSGLIALFGADNQELVKFGFTPQKPHPKRTAEEKVLAAAKAKLTREKRHTQGRKQKAGLRAAETPVVTIGPDGTLIAPPASTAPDASTKPDGTKINR